MAKKIAIFAIDFRRFRHRFSRHFRHDGENGEHFLAIFTIFAIIFRHFFHSHHQSSHHFRHYGEKNYRHFSPFLLFSPKIDGKMAMSPPQYFINFQKLSYYSPHVLLTEYVTLTLICNLPVGKRGPAVSDTPPTLHPGSPAHDGLPHTATPASPHPLFLPRSGQRPPVRLLH